MDALLKIDEGNIEPESVAAEPGNISQCIAAVGESQEPMHGQCPDANPGHEREEVCASRNHDIVDSVREDRYRTSDSDNDQWLAGKEGKYSARQH